MSIAYDSKIVVSRYEHLYGRLVCYNRNAKANSALEPRKADEIDDGNEAVMFPTRGTRY